MLLATFSAVFMVDLHGPRVAFTDAAAALVAVQPFEQVIADAQRVGHRGQRRVHRAARGEEARVDDVQVVEVVRVAIDVER